MVLNIKKDWNCFCKKLNPESFEFGKFIVYIFLVNYLFIKLKENICEYILLTTKIFSDNNKVVYS